jgi:hypothetical protein
MAEANRDLIRILVRSNDTDALIKACAKDSRFNRTRFGYGDDRAVQAYSDGAREALAAGDVNAAESLHRRKLSFLKASRRPDDPAVKIARRVMADIVKARRPRQSGE